MSTYHNRKAAGLCVTCGGTNDRPGMVYCKRCNEIHSGYQKNRAARVHVALSGVGGSKLERIFSFVVKAGKIKPKPKLEAAEMQRRAG